MKEILSFLSRFRLQLKHGLTQGMLMLGLFFTTAAFGQTEQWKKTYGGTEGDFLTVVQQTSDEGYILGGYSYSDKSGDKSQDTHGDCISAEPEYRYRNCSADFWVVKVDAAGAKQWDKTFGGFGDDRLAALQQTKDGGYILGGTSLSAQGGDKTRDSLGGGDYWVVKLDAAGKKQWDKTFGGADKETLSDLQQTTDGGYILGGDSNSDIGGDKSEARWTRCAGENGCTPDYWVLKLDAAGNKVWDRTLGGRATEHLAALRQTPDGGYIAGGYSYSGINGNKKAIHQGGTADFWLVKLDGAGKKKWDKSYGSVGRDLLTALQVTSDGGFIVGGYVKSGFNGDITGDNNGDSDYWLLKLDGEGNKQWDKIFGGRDPDFLNAVQQTRDGGYIVGGRAYSYTFEGDYTWGRGGYWVIKLDAAGNRQWDKPFDARGPVNFVGPGTLIQARDGNYVLGSTVGSYSDGGQREDYQLLKITGGLEPVLLSFDSFSPTRGLPGSTVTIRGKNLGKTESVWFFGGKLKKAKFKVINDDMLTATVPHSAKSGNIFLFSAEDTLESAEPFLVRQPVINSFSPGEGPTGTTVTLTGDRFSTATAVYFNEIAAVTFTVVSDEQLTAVVPDSATTGPVRVLLQGGGQVTSKTNFTVTPSDVAELTNQQQARKETAAAAAATREAPAIDAFPNPFNRQLTYRFSLPKAQPVTVQVYDLLGRQVHKLYQGEVAARQAVEVRWQPEGHQPAGFYLIRLQAPGQESQQRVLLTR